MGDNWFAFDLSALDPNASLTIELRCDDVCLLPPVQIGLGPLTAQANDGGPLPDSAYAFDSLIRSPTGTA
jgi:hypothetical protein